MFSDARLGVQRMLHPYEGHEGTSSYVGSSGNQTCHPWVEDTHGYRRGDCNSFDYYRSSIWDCGWVSLAVAGLLDAAPDGIRLTQQDRSQCNTHLQESGSVRLS